MLRETQYAQHVKEIQACERKLRAQRDATGKALARCGEALRNGVTSSWSLAWLAAIGYLVGENTPVTAAHRAAPEAPVAPWQSLLRDLSALSPLLLGAAQLWDRLSPVPGPGEVKANPETEPVADGLKAEHTQG